MVGLTHIGAVSGGLALWLVSSAAGAAPLNAEQADRLRIQQHLADVEQRLRATPVDGLAPAARGERSKLLDELRRYREAGVFPHNTGHALQRRPYFIDDEGRACAVGELVIRSGHEALAQRIDQRFHTEYVPNMADAELVTWAEQHGFSVTELAQIQPTYCNCDGWNGGFGPEDAVGGAGGAPNGADYFQPVCAANGLTYWNECVAKLCGGVTVVATGQCEAEPPCELCGTGTRPAVVAECEEQGICNGIDSQPQVVPVSQAVATRWLDLQQANCESPQYTLEDEQEWRPAYRVRESWSCSNLLGEGGAAGQPAAAGGNAPDGSSSGGTPPDDDTEAGAIGGAGASSESGPITNAGCDCRVAAPRHGHAAIAGLLLALVALAQRRRKHPRA